jgi:hypothetical protein
MRISNGLYVAFFIFVASLCLQSFFQEWKQNTTEEFILDTESFEHQYSLIGIDNDWTHHHYLQSDGNNTYYIDIRTGFDMKNEFLFVVDNFSYRGGLEKKYEFHKWHEFAPENKTSNLQFIQNNGTNKNNCYKFSYNNEKDLWKQSLLECNDEQEEKLFQDIFMRSSEEDGFILKRMEFVGQHTWKAIVSKFERFGNSFKFDLYGDMGFVVGLEKEMISYVSFDKMDNMRVNQTIPLNQTADVNCLEITFNDSTYDWEIKPSNDDKLLCTDELILNINSKGNVENLQVNKKNIFYTNTFAHVQGSEFWTSPQLDWHSTCDKKNSCWPPPRINYNKRNGTYESDVFQNGLQIRKQFIRNPTKQQFHIRYELHNTNEETIQIAPWEVQFFERNQNISHYFDSTSTTIIHNDNNLPLFTPLLYDGGEEKWIATVVDDLIFIRSHDHNIAKEESPEDESEIQLLIGNKFMEVGLQGALQTIPPNGTYEWNTYWTIILKSTNSSESETIQTIRAHLSS